RAGGKCLWFKVKRWAPEMKGRACMPFPFDQLPERSFMLNTIYSTRGMAVAPHSLAAQAALSVLREGGNAIEAMLAAASTIAVVYPHMNGIGGDGFWVVSEPGKPVQAIEACGVAAAAASVDFYAQRQLDTIPMRGPLAANTLAGTVGGWQQALDISATWGGSLPLSR